ncbi:MAG: hypothetical protein OXM61_22985 [Candidatus Poribacteria bacterium]|nr:hypothetical protein [Candidatus Poribacteria bacterium]
MAQNNFLPAKVFPAIYSGYNDLLNGIYSEWGLDSYAEKLTFLQTLQDSVKELWNEYQKTEISPNYRRHDYQIVYLLRYFFPHSLVVPAILDSLWNRDEFSEKLSALFEWRYFHVFRDECCHHYLNNRLLTTSFFGCGPCPELYGLMHYLGNRESRITRISSAMFDIEPTIKDSETLPVIVNDHLECPGWEYSKVITFEQLLHQVQKPRLYKFTDFESDIAAEDGNFLHPTSEKWVKNSNLIVSQFCLNEIPTPRHGQLKTNLMHVLNIMEPGALMLIVERQGYVEELLEDLHDQLSIKFSDSIQMCRESYNQLNLRDLNNHHIPEEIVHNLFLRIQDNGTWLANKVDYHWLAIFKY